ncbi:coiled-coil domain-containing protein 93 isoform X1 [Fopius arisanus]|uniref:Coiled-coil domain-containing protein 93 n=2 Tax=Fopius arisanus TaxID=64838 RepID=A0A0C9RCW3_9HYME|nr:PREDICTED: coiled-coil domain-containing protein 93 isoform X1 [Fopius arisanus]
MLNEKSMCSIPPSDVVEADVREDEEQAVKFNEIVDLLVAAGYFRARIKGLSNFDKVVGGMTWCIESCNFDVDVNLLFHENLTIGQKIALTEKIVAMLPIMNCPHCIEPHQIQGLDCIHIFPVIQWLVKRSMEMRKEMAGFVREFAINQFGKLHSSDGKTEKNRVVSEDIEANLKLVKRAYEPRRRFKRATAEPKDEISRVKSTLLEYGNLPVSTTISEDFEKEQKSSEVVREVDSENSGARLVTLEEERLSASAVGNIVGLQAQEIIEVSEKYASLSTEAGDIRSGLRLLIALEKQRLNFQYRVKKLKKEREMQISEISEETEKLEQIQADRQNVEDAFVKMSKMETEENKGILLKLEELLAVHAGLKDQEHKFREQCKSDLMYLQKLVKNCGETCEPQEEQNRVVEYDALKESINKTRLLLAKKNRAIALLMRQLDDVPGRSELTQYQRRFMELYNQVSTKHKETKQYYTLYNTLDDTKLYLSKELSLLNSIQENYNEAMASVSGKEQFLKQFEAIISGVKRNREKVEKKCAEEKERRFNLNKDLVTLVEQQRKYVAAVRQLTIECRKNEALLGRLRAS